MKILKFLSKTLISQLISLSAYQLQKMLAIFVVVCFFISSVCHDVIAVTAIPVPDATEYKQIFSDFMLPYTYGKITKSHFAGTDRVIINIQDLHCHPQVQKNISNIIEMFDKKYGVTNVYLEGAYGSVSTKWLTENIKNNDDKTEILNKILKAGKLTGAEYYSASSDKTEIIKGLEKKGPYLDNLKRFGDLLDKQEEIQTILKGIEESTAKVKKQYYTKKQYKIEKLAQEYITGKIPPEKYYKLLMKNTEELGIDLMKYENTWTYISLLALQKQLNYKVISNQLQELLVSLKGKIPYSAYKMLLDNTKNFKQKDILYIYIIKICRELGFDLIANFSELNKYFTYIELSQKINPLELVKEKERLTMEINTRFSETIAQREVVFLTDFEKYLKDYMSIKITSDDYEYYKENIETYKRLYNKYVDNKVLTLLQPYMEEIDTFYKINTDRNDYFTENIFDGIETDKIENIKEEKKEVNKIIENMGQVKRVDVIVTGGFHSQTVTEILQKQGVSYIVITPNIQGGVGEAEKTYYEIAKEQKEINFQALATLPIALIYTEKEAKPYFIKLLIESGLDKKIIISYVGQEYQDEIDKISNMTDEAFEKEYGKKDFSLKDVREIKQKVESAKMFESDEDLDSYEKNIKIISKVLNIDNLSSEDVMNIIQDLFGIEQQGIFNKIFNALKRDRRRKNDIKNIGNALKILLQYVDGDITLIEEFEQEAQKAGTELKYVNTGQDKYDLCYETGTGKNKKRIYLQDFVLEKQQTIKAEDEVVVEEKSEFKEKTTDVKKQEDKKQISLNYNLSIFSPQKINEKVKNRFGENSFFYKITNWFAQHENFYVTVIAPLWEEGVFGLGALILSMALGGPFAIPVFLFIRIGVFSLLHAVVEYYSGEVTDSKDILKKLAYRLAGSTIFSIPYIFMPGMPFSSYAIATGIHGLFNVISNLSSNKLPQFNLIQNNANVEANTNDEFNFFDNIKQMRNPLISSLRESLVLVFVTIVDTVEKVYTGNLNNNEFVGKAGKWLLNSNQQYRNISEKQDITERNVNLNIEETISKYMEVNEKDKTLISLQEIETARQNEDKSILQKYSYDNLQKLRKEIEEKDYKQPKEYEGYSFNLQDISNYLLNKLLKEKMEQDLNKVESDTVKYTIGVVIGLILSVVSLFLSTGDASVLLPEKNLINFTNFFLALFGSNIVSNLNQKRSSQTTDTNTEYINQKADIKVSETANADSEYSFLSNIKQKIKPLIRSLEESLVFVPVTIVDTAQKVYTGNLNNDEFVGKAGQWFLKNFNKQYKDAVKQQEIGTEVKDNIIDIIKEYKILKSVIILSDLWNKKVTDIKNMSDKEKKDIKGQLNRINEEIDFENKPEEYKGYSFHHLEAIAENLSKVIDENVDEDFDEDDTIGELVKDHYRSFMKDNEDINDVFKKYGYPTIETVNLLQEIEENRKITENIEKDLREAEEDFEKAKKELEKVQSEEKFEEVKKLGKKIKKLKNDLKKEGLSTYKDEQLQAYGERLKSEIDDEEVFENYPKLKESAEYLLKVIIREQNRRKQKEIEKGLNKVESNTIKYTIGAAAGLILTGLSVFFSSGNLSVLLTENNLITITVALFVSNIINNLRWKLQYLNSQLTDTEGNEQEIDIDNSDKYQVTDDEAASIDTEYSLFGSIKQIIVPFFFSLIQSGFSASAVIVDTAQKIYTGNLNNDEYVGTLGQIFLNSMPPYRNAIEHQKNIDEQTDDMNKRIKEYKSAKFLQKLFYIENDENRTKTVGEITDYDKEEWEKLKTEEKTKDFLFYDKEYSEDILYALDYVFNNEGTIASNKSIVELVCEKMEENRKNIKDKENDKNGVRYTQFFKSIDSFFKDGKIYAQEGIKSFIKTKMDSDVQINKDEGLKLLEELEEKVLSYENEEKLQNYREKLEYGIKEELFENEEEERAVNLMVSIIEEQREKGKQLQKEMEQDLNKVENRTIVYSTMLTVGLLRTGIAMFLISGDASVLLTGVSLAKIFVALIGSNIVNDLKWKRKFSNSQLLGIKSTKKETDIKKTISVKYQNLKLSKPLPLSIFSPLAEKYKGNKILGPIFSFLDEKAHLWEEGFRFVPQIASAYPTIFFLSQVLFLFLHFGYVTERYQKEKTKNWDIKTFLNITVEEMFPRAILTGVVCLPYIIASVITIIGTTFGIPIGTPAKIAAGLAGIYLHKKINEGWGDKIVKKLTKGKYSGKNLQMFESGKNFENTNNVNEIIFKMQELKNEIERDKANAVNKMNARKIRFFDETEQKDYYENKANDIIKNLQGINLAKLDNAEKVEILGNILEMQEIEAFRNYYNKNRKYFDIDLTETIRPTTETGSIDKQNKSEIKEGELEESIVEVYIKKIKEANEYGSLLYNTDKLKADLKEQLKDEQFTQMLLDKILKEDKKTQEYFIKIVNEILEEENKDSEEIKKIFKVTNEKINKEIENIESKIKTNANKDLFETRNFKQEQQLEKELKAQKQQLEHMSAIVEEITNEKEFFKKEEMQESEKKDEDYLVLQRNQNVEKIKECFGKNKSEKIITQLEMRKIDISKLNLNTVHLIFLGTIFIQHTIEYSEENNKYIEKFLRADLKNVNKLFEENFGSNRKKKIPRKMGDFCKDMEAKNWLELENYLDNIGYINENPTDKEQKKFNKLNILFKRLKALNYTAIDTRHNGLVLQIMQNEYFIEKFNEHPFLGKLKDLNINLIDKTIQDLNEEISIVKQNDLKTKSVLEMEQQIKILETIKEKSEDKNLAEMIFLLDEKEINLLINFGIIGARTTQLYKRAQAVAEHFEGFNFNDEYIEELETNPNAMNTLNEVIDLYFDKQIKLNTPRGNKVICSKEDFNNDEKFMYVGMSNSEKNEGEFIDTYGEYRFGFGGQNIFFKKFGFEFDKESKHLHYASYEGSEAIRNTLYDIKKMAKIGRGMFSFDGHGTEEGLWIDNNICMSPEQLAEALSKGKDLSGIVIDLSSCHSYYFAQNLIAELTTKYGFTEETLPIILTEAGKETKLGYTVEYKGERMSSFWKGLLLYLDSLEAQGINLEKDEFTIDDIVSAVLSAESFTPSSNSSLFVPNKGINKELERIFREAGALKTNKKEDKGKKAKGSSVITGSFSDKTSDSTGIYSDSGSLNEKYFDNVLDPKYEARMLQKKSTVEILQVEKIEDIKNIEGIRGKFFAVMVILLKRIVSFSGPFEKSKHGVRIGAMYEAPDIFKIITNFINPKGDGEKQKNKFIEEDHDYTGEDEEINENLSTILKQTQIGFALTAIVITIAAVGFGSVLFAISPLLLFVALPAVALIGFYLSLVAPHAKVNLFETETTDEDEDENTLNTEPNKNKIAEVLELNINDSSAQKTIEEIFSLFKETEIPFTDENIKFLEEINKIKDKLKTKKQYEINGEEVKREEAEEAFNEFIKILCEIDEQPAKDIISYLKTLGNNKFIDFVKKITDIDKEIVKVVLNSSVHTGKKNRNQYFGYIREHIDKYNDICFYFKFVEKGSISEFERYIDAFDKDKNEVKNKMKKIKENIEKINSDPERKIMEEFNKKFSFAIDYAMYNLYLKLGDMEEDEKIIILTSILYRQGNEKLKEYFLADERTRGNIEEEFYKTICDKNSKSVEDLKEKVNNVGSIWEIVDETIHENIRNNFTDNDNLSEEDKHSKVEEIRPYLPFTGLISFTLLSMKEDIKFEFDNNIDIKDFYLTGRGNNEFLKIYLGSPTGKNNNKAGVLHIYDGHFWLNGNEVPKSGENVSDKSRYTDREKAFECMMSAKIIHSLLTASRSNFKKSTEHGDSMLIYKGKELPKNTYIKIYFEKNSAGKLIENEIRSAFVVEKKLSVFQIAFNFAFNSLKEILKPTRSFMKKVYNKYTKYKLFKIVNNKQLCIVDFDKNENKAVIEELTQKAEGNDIEIYRRSIKEKGVERGGHVIGSIYDNQVRLKFKDNEAIFYSHTINLNNVSNIDEKIEELMNEYVKSGVKNEDLGDNTVVAFADNSDGNLTINNIADSITHKQTDYVTRPFSEIYSLSDNEKITENNCKGIAASYGTTTFSVSRQQYDNNKTTIESLEKQGYNFIIEGTDSDASIINLTNKQYTNKEDIIKDLNNRRKEMLSKNGNVNVTGYVKLSENELEKLNGINVFETTGLIPLVDAKILSNEINVGKVGVYNIATEEQFEKIKQQSEVVCLIFDKNSEGILNKIKSLVEEVINKMNSPQSKFKTGEVKALSEQKYQLNLAEQSIEEAVKNLDNLLTLDVPAFLEYADEETVNNNIKEMIQDNMKLFNSVAQGYIQEQLDKGNYIEALGFVRGVVENSLAEQIVKKLDIKDDFIKEINTNENRAIIILTMQAMLQGKGKTLDELYNTAGEGSFEMTAKQYLDSIRVKLNANLDETLRQNEYKFVIAEAGIDFDGIPELLIDNYGSSNVESDIYNSSINEIKALLIAA